MTLSAQNAIAWSRQESAVALTWFASATYPKTFRATGAGNANGCTIVSSTLGSYASANDDFVGAVIEVVYAANGPTGERGAPIRRRVMSYAHATTTLTVEDLGFQTSADDSFRLMRPPHAYWSESTGGSQTKFVDALRDEADDYWNGAAEKGGPYLNVLAADSIATTINTLVVNFTQASGTVSTASMSASTAIGDLAEAWEWPEVFSGVPLSFNQARLDRGSVTGRLGVHRGVAGLREGSGQTELAFRGPGSSRAGSPAELDTPLGAVMTAAAGTDYTADASCTTSAIQVTSGTPTADTMYCSEGGDVWVATTTAEPMVPSPTLRTAPAQNEAITGMRTYKPDNALNYAVTIKQWHGKEMYDLLFGCVPSVSFSGARGEYLKCNLSWQVGDGMRVYETSAGADYSRPIDPKLPTVVPRMLGDVRVNLGGTEFEARSFSVDLGLNIQPKVNLAAPNETDGCALRNDAPSGTIELFMDSDSKGAIQDFLKGAPKTLLIQAGKSTGDPGVWAFWAYEIEYTGAEVGDDAGAITVSLPFRVTNDTTSSLSRWMIGIG